MAEINNFSEINENFDTVKTLLNQIRAQGVLNTSDVDKLLAGINSKLEKINTEEDIDLIKAFLTELKQNLDERHSVLVSKFGAIEALFSNLLKNSSEAVKTSEIKELFDIVATNLSVFSREVVAQKESLTDITLRLDAIRSDDTQKKDIIKSVTSVKNEVEHLNNGFDSIVLSLNENFKTVLKTISEIDQSEAITGFSNQLTEIINSSNAVLSAIQMIDKKNNQFDDAVNSLATQKDAANIQRSIIELTAKSKEINDLVDAISQKSYKIDNLADKIDASVSIIAGLKTEIADKDDNVSKTILERLDKLENTVKEVATDPEFEEFKLSLTSTLSDIAANSTSFKNSLNDAAINIDKLKSDLKALDINLGFQNLSTGVVKVGEDIKEKFVSETEKISQLFDVNIQRAISDISSNAENLNTRLKDTHTALTVLCEKNFGEMTDTIAGLKTIVSQLDDNNVSANNAIFSNITDRLTVFENSLKESLEKQEDYVSTSSSQLIEQIGKLGKITETLDYKMDASVIEINNTKREYEDLKTAINNVLGLDFVNVVKDLRVDLYAVKQDLSNAVETSEGNITEKFTNDLFGKYELLISKLDSVEDEIKNAQQGALSELKTVLDNISSSVIDIISYVSVQKESNNEYIEDRLAQLAEIVKDSNLNYVENVRDIVDVIRTQVESNLEEISKDSTAKINKLTSSISESNTLIKNDIKKSYDKLVEVQSNFDEIKGIIGANKHSITENIDSVLNSTNDLKQEFESKLTTFKNNILDKIAEFKKEFSCENADKINELKFNAETLHTKSEQQLTETKEEVSAQIETLIENLRTLDETVGKMSTDTTSSLMDTLSQTLENFVSLKSLINNNEEKTTANIKASVEEIKQDFATLRNRFNDLDSTIDEDLARQVSIIEGNFESINHMLTDIINQGTEQLGNRIKNELSSAANLLGDTLEQKLEDYKSQLESLFDDHREQSSSQEEFIRAKVVELNKTLNETLEMQGQNASAQLEGIAARLKDVLSENIELTSADYDSLKQKFAELSDEIAKTNENFVESIKAQLDDVTKFIDSGLDVQAQEVKATFEEISSNIQKVNSSVRDFNTDLDAKVANLQNSVEMLKADTQTAIDEKSSAIISNLAIIVKELSDTSSSDTINSKIEEVRSLLGATSETSQNNLISQTRKIIDEIVSLQGSSVEQYVTVKNILDNEVKTNLSNLNEKIQNMFEESSVSFISALGNSSTQLSEELKANVLEFKEAFNSLNERLDKDEVSQMNVYQAQLKELSNTFNTLIEGSKELTKTEISSITDALIKNSKQVFEELDVAIEEKITNLLATSADISAGELQTIEAFANKILEQAESIKQNSIVCKDLITNLIKEQFDIVAKNIEKETDIIVGDFLEQFSLLKDYEKDELSLMSSSLEGSVAGYILDAVNDLKSYMDVRTDSTVINSKLDGLIRDMQTTASDTADNINKLLEMSVFSDAISDLKATNTVLIDSMAEKLNTQIQEFITTNVSKSLAEKLNLFDKKFTETIVDKYEEIQLLASKNNDSIEKANKSVQQVISDFVSSKDEIKSDLNDLYDRLNDSVDELKTSFAELKSHILNKSLDVAFHNEVKTQIKGIEDLVQEQLSYMEDISDLCCNNLPELTEMNTLVKYGVQQSLSELKDKVDAQDVNLPKELNKLKSDIVTQFINVFNQISFVAEQEEILDFIQDKHSELITILSHIVTTADGVETVKDNLAVVDNKMDSLKEDINLINEKITAIMSSEGDIDYVYSLQDLESDIANLRIVLNEMKDNMPNFEAEEFKKEFESLAEDIVSISTRTNKLILASDESYKTLQDNLQDFKLVIDDLDERTKNFARESGLDRMNQNLSSMNTMIRNGEKTNQAFNQVFEYLAEWVDKAGAQISSISDKVETLNDVGQIKVMLEDLKAASADNSENEELIEGLGTVFEKQAKRIASLESKLDRMIVDNTINNKNNKIDMAPFEDTLNKFLVAIDDKMVTQQKKINSLETKLAEALSLIDNKDTAQLTKKVGGMDRQLAKLNKSIEKIASNVVEK